jgi:hypothetical protein
MQINIDNKTRVDYWMVIVVVQLASQYVDLSCPGVASAKTEAEADTQFTIFDLSTLKKQCLISYL